MTSRFIRLAAVTLFLSSTAIHAALINSDFLASGDNLLVTDTVTNLQWLTPVHTKGHTYNDAFVQSIITTHGFRYATATEALDLINNNFGNPPTVFPGTVAGYTAAGNFFSIFGIAQAATCGSPSFPCPRTQGLTSTPGSAGSHLGFGMIQYGSTGYALVNNNWPDTVVDTQMGSWLVRSTAEAPEPSTLAFLTAGLIACTLRRRR